MKSELKQIRENTWCITGHQLIPVYKTDESHCILLDTGVRGFRDQLEILLLQAGLKPAGIIQTHTHYDHFGSTAYFQEKYGAVVAMPIGEAEISRTLAGIKSHLFVFPIGQLAHDLKYSDIPCRADLLIEEDQTAVTVAGVTFEVLHTPGHAIDHISIVTPDRVCCVGDALFSEPVMAAMKLPYAFDFTKCLDSIESLRGGDWPVMILSHCGIEKPPYDHLIDVNRDRMLAQYREVLSLVDRPMHSVEICDALGEKMGVCPSVPEKAQDLERFLRPYLECMVDRGDLRLVMDHHALCYAPV